MILFIFYLARINIIIYICTVKRNKLIITKKKNYGQDI